MPFVKKNSQKPAATTSPVKKNMFSSGSFKGSPLGKKARDNRHLMFIEGLKNGVVVAWLKKWNKNEEPFLAYDMIQLNNNPEICESLGINAIVPRRGQDGDTPLKQSSMSDYDWRQFVFIVGDDKNTAVNRREMANHLIDHMNKNAVIPNYQYPVKVKFAGDKTANPMGTLSDHMLDKHVLEMMHHAYPGMTSEQLIKDSTIVESFWSDVDYGNSFLADNDTGVILDDDEECGDSAAE